MPLSPAQSFNLLVASVAVSVAAEGALLWKWSQHPPQPAPPRAPIAAQSQPAASKPDTPLFSVPGSPVPGGPSDDEANAAARAPFAAPAPLQPAAPRGDAASATGAAAAKLSPAQRAQAKSLFEAAGAALSRGDKKTALANYRRVAQLAPDHLPTRLNLAQLYLDAKSPAGALPQLQKAAQLAPQNPAVQFQLARVLLALKRPAEALAPLRRVVQIAPAEREGRVLLAQVYAVQKQPRQAYTQWAALAQSDPRDVDARLQAAQFAAYLGQARDAQKWLRPIRKDPRAALLLSQLEGPPAPRQSDLATGDLTTGASPSASPSATRPAASGAPDDEFNALARLANARLAAKDWKGARTALQNALRHLPPGQTPAQKAQVAEVEGNLRFALGRALGGAKSPREAKREFARAAALLPRDASVRSLWAVASLQSGDRAGAASALRQAIALDPQRAPDRLFLAQLLAQEKQWNAASAQYAAYARLQPRDASAMLEWASAAHRAKNRELEAQVLTKLAALDPKNPLIWLQRGDLLRAKTPAAALTSFERALELRPTDAGALFEVARLQTQLQRPQAAATWKKLIAARPEYVAAYSALLQSSAPGDAASARMFLARQLAKSDNAAALSAVLRFYDAHGQNAQEQALLSDIVRLNPRARGARAALDARAPQPTPRVTATAEPTASPTPTPSATPTAKP